MDCLQKKQQLQDIIEEKLASLIDRDYVLLDLPYHANIGDTLIALGEKNFLKNIDHKCLYSGFHYLNENAMNEDTLILFHGGGNFGDLWRSCSEFRNSIILKFKNNKIIIFPQSVCYENEKNLRDDVEIYSQCSNLTICARDIVSYEFLKRHFIHNKILLVPDMAFCLAPKYLKPSKKTGKTLFLKRDDKEFVSTTLYNIVPTNADVADWPTFTYSNGPYMPYKIWRKILSMIDRYFDNITDIKIEDFFWQHILHPYNVKCGVDFLNQYDTIYTTRLHAAILGYLLGKRIHIFDSKDGKISALYKTWLKDVDGIDVIK